MTTDTGRTAAATRARMRASEEKLAAKLRKRGWLCFLPGLEAMPLIFDQSKDFLYATNDVQETYRVIDWTMEGKPIFAVEEGRTLSGKDSYVFSVGPK